MEMPAELNYPETMKAITANALPQASQPAREATATSPDLPAALQPQGFDWGKLLQTGLAAAGAAGLLGPNSQQLGQLNQKFLEQRRQQKASDETNALTNLLSTALSSGDHKQLESVIKQVGGLKGLEPETVQSLQKTQFSFADRIAQDKQEDELAKALQASSPETQQVFNSVLKASPGLKLSGVVSLLKSGLVGEPAKTLPVANVGVVRIPGTGVFNRGPLDQPAIVIPAVDGKEKSFNLNDLAYTATTGKPGATTANLTQQEAVGMLNALKEQRQILVPEAFGQRVAIAGAAGEAGALGRARVEAQSDINEIEKSRAITNSIFGLADRLMTAEGKFDTTKQGTLLTAQAYIPGASNAAKAYLDTKEQFVGQLSRSLGGERGVLTDQDVKRMAKGLPGFYDPKSVKDYKKGLTNMMIDAAIEAKRALIDGRPYDQKTFRAKLNHLLNQLDATTTLPPLPPGAKIIGEVK